MICGVCGLRALRNMKEFKAHQKKTCPGGRWGGWKRVTELRTAKDWDGAADLARKLMGVEGPKMTEEQKEKLREYSKTPEAKQRAANRRAQKQIEAKAAKRSVELKEERKASYASRAEKRTGKSKSVKRKR